MSRDWVSNFEAWGRPQSETEDEERRRTEGEIVAALRAHPPLEGKRLSVYAKGSYPRGTNVRRGSDVDIAVELVGTDSVGDAWRTEKLFDAAHLTNEDLGLVSVDLGYTVADLKRDVHAALSNAYGHGAVTRSNKCIKVREKATTLPADVVPCRTHRRYHNRTTFYNGIEIHPDDGGVIVNWPRQDEENGTTKNGDTRLRFKRVVRGLKSLENEMVDQAFMQPVASFLIESAVFNVPSPRFESESNFENCLTALQVMREAANDPSAYSSWVEVNHLKLLFHVMQSWTVADMERLVERSHSYLETG